ncbi:hypothetical protein RhiirA5_395628 [Rhizophagus irregularis]|uniref:Crinkler family protein n=3 Tax=Rhizophagus irregularis TaxID=588596 RepID=A0A2N0Q5Y4_9GLOM|nr:hypothetical protein RirG_165440 [Rhizophagus irregularis DAOM 197198w]PKC14490.1 hypothetical protein RhiirA5_395628 [Rhizophagus irregularis]
MFSTSTSTSASTNVRREFNRLFLVESGITEDEFAELMAYVTNNPNKIPDIEESLKYGTDSFKVKYLRKLLAEPDSKRIKLDNDKNLIKFWRALKNATCENETLKLSKNTHFLGKGYVSILLIRKCYHDLQKIVFDDTIDKLRITGNPGIGKTYFGYYLLYLLAQKDVTIVYDNHHETKPIIFEGNNAYVSNSDGIDVYLRKPAVWYIVDGKEPKDVKAKTILICSPKKNHYKNFDKYEGVVTIRYMPTWKWEEIARCRKELYEKKVSNKKARDCFRKWGGIPRFVLERANYKTHQDKLNSAIKRSKMDIFDYIGESIGDDNVSHMLVHIHVNLPAEDDVSNDDDDDDDVDNNDNSDSNDGDVNVKSGSSASQVQLDKYGEIAYTETVLKFASNKVMKLVTQKLESRIRQRLLEKTKADTGNTLLGTSFEYLAHRILRNGGKFDIRPLDKYSGEVSSDPDAVVDLHTQDEQLYFSKNNIDVIENKMYYQPTEKNFPSIDSIIAPNKVFQMTLAENHPIKTSGLKLLYKKFGGDSAQHLVYFYFVVPEHLYEVYKLQKFVNSDDDDAQRIPKWIDKRIFQYVLKIKL